MSDNLSPPTLHLLCDELRQVVEWDQVAINLKVPFVDIRDIETRYSGLWQRKMHCLQKWLDQSNTVHSWYTVAEAVDKINPAVAEYIRNKYAIILDDVLSTTQYEECTSQNDDIISITHHINEDHQPNKSEVEIDQVIVKTINDFIDRFAMLVAETQASLQQRPNLLTAFYRYLKTLQLKGQSSLPDETDVTYDKLFDVLDTHCHYFNGLRLFKIAQNFLSDTDLPSKLKLYQNDLVAFKKSTKMKDLVDKIIKSRENTRGMVQVTLKVEEMWLEVSLERFELLIKLLLQELKEFLQDIFVKEGCMYVVWNISKEIASLITTTMFSPILLAAIGVISLTVGTTVLYANDLTKDDLTFDIALLRAVQSGGPIPAIALLLEVGGNPNQLIQSCETILSIVSKVKIDDGTTILHVASQYGYSCVISILLHKGINYQASKNGHTLLMIASQSGHDDIVQLLLQRNVPMNTRNYSGSTAIFIASQNGHSSVISTLLSNGADPNLAENDGWTPLMIASQNGHGHIVQLLLERNVYKDIQNNLGANAIFIASQNGHLLIVSTLLGSGANPNLANNNGWTPLMIASQNGHCDVVQILLERSILTNTKNKNGSTAIYIASQNGHSSVVSTLLDNRADPNLAKNNGWTPLMIASQNGHSGTIQILLERKVPSNTRLEDGRTAIFIASQNGHSSVVSTLLDNGADPNLSTNNGWTPLMIASQNGHVDVVQTFLQRNVSTNTQNNIGSTAIYLASQNGHFSVVFALLSNGADHNLARDNGTTPFMIASECGHNDVVQLLLEKNIAANAQNDNGETAIYLASQNGHSSVVSTLLNNGIDPNLAEKDGWTPLMIASQGGYDDIVHLLLERNVSINTQNNNGSTAILIASQNGHSSIISTLLTNGADPNIAYNDTWTVNEHVSRLFKPQINIQETIADLDLRRSITGSIESGYVSSRFASSRSSLADTDSRIFD